MPDLASTYVDSRLGVPSARRPALSTSQARRGFAPVASTTRVGSAVVRRFLIFAVARAGESAKLLANVSATFGVVPTASGLARVWLTPCQPPFGAEWTTRSPPRTRRPW